MIAVDSKVRAVLGKLYPDLEPVLKLLDIRVNANDYDQFMTALLELVMKH